MEIDIEILDALNASYKDKGGLVCRTDCFLPLTSEGKVSYWHNNFFRTLVKRLLVCSIFCKRNLSFSLRLFQGTDPKGAFQEEMPILLKEIDT